MTAQQAEEPAAAGLSAWFAQNGALLGGLFALGIVSLLLTVVLLPLVVVRMPADHFTASRRERAERRTAGWWVVRIAKNVLGLVFVLAGLAMLVLPGQGLLTLLIGLLLLEFPGKRALELRLVRRPAIRRLLDRLRQKHGRPPLEVDGP